MAERVMEQLIADVDDLVAPSRLLHPLPCHLLRLLQAPLVSDTVTLQHLGVGWYRVIDGVRVRQVFICSLLWGVCALVRRRGLCRGRCFRYKLCAKYLTRTINQNDFFSESFL